MTREKMKMANKEALRIIEEYGLDDGGDSELHDAIRTAVKLLKQEPCEDCISRKALLDAIYQKEYGTDYYDGNMLNIPYIDLIKQMPRINPAEKVGHWEQYGNSWEDKFKCSECGKEQPKILCGERIIEHFSDYCPNCGAKMEGGNEEE